MNNVSLVGRLVKDAEVLSFKNSDKMALKFTIAVERTYRNAKGEKGVDFIQIIYFTQFADKLSKYVIKGKRVGVIGRLAVNSYVDENNIKRYQTNVVADNIQFLDKIERQEIV
ncbi:single-stranded DNA-binding protein [Fervidicella metallireducens]|nr:single-stranded DNA-binding protein [Fervidicella metallireducens]